MFHVFINCKFAKDCWQVIGLGYDTSTIESFQEWLLQRLILKSTEKEVQLTKVCGESGLLRIC